MNETFYIFIGLILYTITAIALGFMLGKYKGEEIGLRNGGVLTGKDAERFHKKIDKNNKKQGSVDFSKESESNKRILNKSKSVLEEEIEEGLKEVKQIREGEIPKPSLKEIKLNSVSEEEVEANRPKSAPYLLDLTPNIFERGGRSRYQYIQSKEDYTRFLNSGMFWEHWPELSGNWKEDKKIIHKK